MVKKSCEIDKIKLQICVCVRACVRVYVCPYICVRLRICPYEKEKLLIKFIHKRIMKCLYFCKVNKLEKGNIFYFFIKSSLFLDKLH